MKPAILICAFLLALPAAADDAARDIVRKALDRDNLDFQRARDYTYRQQQITRETDAKGAVTSTRSRTHEVVILYGRPFSRLVEKDGKPLSDADRRKEQEREDKEIAARKREQEDAASKEHRNFEKRRAESRKFVGEILDAFDFRLVGEEAPAGRPAWIIEGVPRPGYKPRDASSRILTKLRGRLWIDKEAYEWIRIESEVTGDISIGLVLAKVSKGSWIHAEKRRVNGEVWLPSRVNLALDGRLAVFKKLRTTVEITYSDYRKFQADSKVVATQAIP